jgi:dimethylaniline monooxygenase (N-oxide forming)
MISPYMAANDDRSIFFPGQIHSVFTPLVAEVQALWGIAWMLDMIDTPSRDDMEKEVAVWNAWTAKRYGDMGRRHSYSIYDYLAVSLFDIPKTYYTFVFFLIQLPVSSCY